MLRMRAKSHLRPYMSIKMLQLGVSDFLRGPPTTGGAANHAEACDEHRPSRGFRYAVRDDDRFYVGKDEAQVFIIEVRATSWKVFKRDEDAFGNGKIATVIGR